MKVGLRKGEDLKANQQNGRSPNDPRPLIIVLETYCKTDCAWVMSVHFSLFILTLS